MKRQSKKKGERYYRKRGTTGQKRQRKQKGDFPNRYDFTFAGRDVFNQAGKVAPGVIKQETNNVDQMVKNRLNQAISSGGA